MTDGGLPAAIRPALLLLFVVDRDVFDFLALQHPGVRNGHHSPVFGYYAFSSSHLRACVSENGLSLTVIDPFELDRVNAGNSDDGILDAVVIGFVFNS